MKKLLSSLLVLGIGLNTVAVLPIAQPTQAQTQPKQQELERLQRQAAQQTKQGQHQQAVATLQQVLKLAQQLKNRKTEAEALNRIGFNYYRIGQSQKALEYCNRALQILRAVSDRVGEATTLNNIGAVYDSTGEPQKELEYYNQALSITRAVSDRAGEATTLNNIALFYRNNGQPQKAVEYFKQSLPLFRAVKDKPQEVTTLKYIGFIYVNNGQPQKALEYFKQSLPLIREVKDRSQEAITLGDIGFIYKNTGQPQKALEYFNQSLLLSRELGDRAEEPGILSNIGGVYKDIGQSQKALEYFNRALSLSRKFGDSSTEAIALNNIGLIYNLLKQPQKALEYLNQALPLSREFSRELGDSSKEATVLDNIGQAYSQLKQPQKALEYYNHSLLLSREVDHRSVVLSDIGVVYYELKQPQKALEYLNQALPLSREAGDRYTEASTLSNIGAVYRDTKRPSEAVKNWEQSVQITLEIRGGLERSNRQAFLQEQRGTGICLIDLLIRQNQSERAYQWVNLTTTADLADYSRLIDAKVANPQAQRAIEKWNQSNRQLENLRQQLQQKFSSGLSAQVNQLQAQVNQQAETISRQFPEVAELFETKPTDIARLRANIPAGTVVIQPVLLTNKNVPNTIALFVLTKNKLTVTQQKIDPQAFDALVTQYRQELTDGRFNKYRATSAKLYDILIRPVEGQIAANRAKQLSIIATGKLRYIPFETLIDSKMGKYLIQKYPINNLTRLSTRPIQSNKQKETLLAVGNPFPNDGRSLQGAEQEVKSITALLPGSEDFLGAQAKLVTFETQAPRFSILHLATHGCFRPQGCPDLQLPANSILFRDRNLNIADAALLGLKNTDLVVLSACQTAVQANSSGEEFAGIAYLFERAGARSVIASLWLAKDEETKELMIHFYQNLKKGMTKGEALRQAKLSLIDKHPLYWSPFILIGDAR